MNIKEAKEQIKNAIIAYGTTDAHHHPLIPIQKQRPIFVIGAPGIGKTAIMEQIAEELDIALVSYSMTHHTRQSALGLPFIVEKNYGGQTYKVSEYTMSEIIASVYEAMEKTQKKKGILFLDEINCISETLAPSMLQFLQYKTFGRHQVPEGWVIVTAGNPPEFNQSVKEFDIVTWDRLKKIEVEADYEAWKGYAVNVRIHPVVTSYLNIKPSHFYRISTTVDGKQFVTARGWDDLSQMITLYEANRLEVNYHLVSQYLQDEEIAKDFSHYYQLFHKYQSDYQINEILDGSYPTDIIERAKQAPFDERLSLIALLMSRLDEIINEVTIKEKTLNSAFQIAKTISSTLAQKNYLIALQNKIADYQLDIKQKEAANALSKAQQTQADALLDYLKLLYEKISASKMECLPQACVKQQLKEDLAILKQDNQNVQDALQHAFSFFEQAFGQGQEILILVTEMTINESVSQYIYAHGCPKYFEHNAQLLFKDKEESLRKKIDAIHLLDFDTLPQ